MLKKLKHGFTLVELVIVIAVIAVLAAVLIPTFITVIDNANNSADLQLVANMNTVLSTDLTADGTATAENLRKLLKDNGITDITTKNKNNVIVYNKAEKKFKRLNVTDTLKNKEVAYADGGTNFLEENPYSVEEIFAGNIVVSMGGNDFAEALYRLHNLTATSDVNNIMSKLGSNYQIKTILEPIIQSTAYIGSDNTVRQLVKDGNRWSLKSELQSNVIRVVFDESVSTFDIGAFEDSKYDTATIILPNTLQSVSYEGEKFAASGSAVSTLRFAGNTELLAKLVEEDKITSDRLMEGTVEEVKTAVAELGEKLSRAIFYVANTTDKENFIYSKVSEAIAAATYSTTYSGKPVSVIITVSPFIINEDVTIPKNVTLNIPFYQNGDQYCTGIGYGGTNDTPQNNSFVCEKSIVDDDIPAIKKNYTKNYKQFEITLNGNIIVDGGTLQIGGVTSHANQFYQGHTSGYYGQLNIEDGKSVKVTNNGKLYSYGYIKGDGGTVTIENSGSAYEPFIVTDFSGGSNSLTLYGSHQSPFLRYAMVNIQSQLTVNYGGLLWAHCNLVTAETNYNETDQIVIGYGDKYSINKGLITLEEQSSKAICIYEYSSDYAVVDVIDGNNLKGDIGKTTVTLYGNARTEDLKFLGLVSTSYVLFPVPFNFDFVIAEGNFSVYNNYVILPGAKVTVESNATLSIKENSSFYVMDCLIQGASMSGKTYPTAQQLSNNTTKLSTSGVLTVNGNFEVAATAKVGGVIRTEQSGATLDIAKGATVSGEITIGGIGSGAANTSTYAFPLRVFDVNSAKMNDYKNGDDGTLKFANVSAGSTYRSTTENVEEQNLVGTTTVYYYKLYSDCTDDEQADLNNETVVAVGKQFMNIKGSGTVQCEKISCGFKQESGYDAQRDSFKNKGYNYAGGKTFEQAVEAIDAYYALTPLARQEVAKPENGEFDINAYSSVVVSKLFVKTYEAAFKDKTNEEISQTYSTIDAILAITNAYNKLQTISDNVKQLLDDKTILKESATINNTVTELHSEDSNVILFSVAYPTQNETTFNYASTFNVFGEDEPIDISNYKVEEQGTTTVYFVKSMAPESQTLQGYYKTPRKPEKELLTVGYSDPAGTLFYAAWQNYVMNVESGDEKINTVKFDIFTDLKLLLTGNYSQDATSQGTQLLNQSLNVAPNMNIDINLNEHKLTFGVDYDTRSTAMISNKGGMLNLHNGTVDSSYFIYPETPNPINNWFGDWRVKTFGNLYMISSDGASTYGKTTLTDLTLKVRNVDPSQSSKGPQQNNPGSEVTFAGGIKSNYKTATTPRPGSSSSPTPEYFGEISVTNVNIIGGSKEGININGGYATLDGVHISGSSKGVYIQRTATIEGEPKGVKIINSDIEASSEALSIGGGSAGTYLYVENIENCQLNTTNYHGYALKIEDSRGMAKLCVKQIKDCTLVSPYVALQIAGNSVSQKAVIESIQNCTIIADNILSSSSSLYYDTNAIKLDKFAEIGKLQDCVVVAATAVPIDYWGDPGDEKTATAVYVGSDCSLNMVYNGEKDYSDDGSGNWFAASSGNKATVFDIKNNGIVTMNTYEFVQETNLSKTTEYHGGYDCYKLQQQAA